MLCSRHAAGAFPALPSVCWAALLSWLHHLSWSSFRAWQKPPQAQSPPDTQHPVLVLQVLLFCFGCPLELKLSFPNEWQKKSLGPGVLGASSERGDLGLFGHWLKPISGCTGAERRGSHQCSSPCLRPSPRRALSCQAGRPAEIICGPTSCQGEPPHSVTQRAWGASLPKLGIHSPAVWLRSPHDDAPCVLIAAANWDLKCCAWGRQPCSRCGRAEKQDVAHGAGRGESRPSLLLLALVPALLVSRGRVPTVPCHLQAPPLGFGWGFLSSAARAPHGGSQSLKAKVFNSFMCFVGLSYS